MCSSWSRRTVLGALTAPLLVGCSSDSGSDANSLLSMMRQSFGIFSGGRSIARDQVAKIPYATLGLRVGGSGEVLLVLATQRGSVDLWTSASHIAIETRSGRISRTAGLPHNLSTTAVEGEDPLRTGLQRLQGSAAFFRRLDLADRNAYQVLVQSALAIVGLEDISVLGTHIRCVHAVERCTCEQLGWKFANEYWADAGSGFIWRSSQIVHPDLDTVEIEIFRPPVA